jgi:hypothetical protein
MVLFEINPESIARVEFESNAPRTIDMNRVAGWNESFQRMKVKPWKVHLFRRGCDIKAIKPDQDTFVHLDVDLRSAAFRPQVGKGFASKRLDHGLM